MIRAAFVGLTLLALTACNERAAGRTPTGPPPVPVTAGMAVKRDVPVQVTAVGNVMAYTTVGVKSQVAGQIARVHFTEGQDVQRNDLLFTIDPRPLEATLRQAEANVGRDVAALRQAEAALAQRQAEVAQAEANLERDTAQLENARVSERRYRDLVEKEFIAREQYDQVRTNALALQATVAADRAAVANAKASAQAAQASVDNVRAVIEADKAAVESARLQLAYTTIRASMDGRTGNILVHAGNVVKGNDDNPMVVISQVHPIYVSFSIPEQYLADIKRYRADGPLVAEAYPERAGPVARGVVTFVNSTVDPATGTIQLKATFANDTNVLWPGQFVDVVLTLTTKPGAVVVPTPAIQVGQQGPFVYVIKPDQTVEPRAVQPGLRLAGETVVDAGLAGGERIVTDGQLRLAPGAKVEIKAR